jgi:hypothetical protein
MHNGYTYNFTADRLYPKSTETQICYKLNPEFKIARKAHFCDIVGYEAYSHDCKIIAGNLNERAKGNLRRIYF